MFCLGCSPLVFVDETRVAIESGWDDAPEAVRAPDGDSGPGRSETLPAAR